ncbi:MAG: hypothetical protein V3R43_02530 [bacterium]
MPTVQFAFANLLEQSGITITVTDAATGNPKEHLYDRDLVFPWKAADASGDKEIKVDQGASGTFAVDTALIAGHNLDGLTCFLEHSPDNTVWSGYDGGAGSFAATAGVIELTVSGGPLTKRYWRLRITAPSGAPEVGEFFLTEQKTFERNYRFGAAWGKAPNITVLRGPSGAAFKAKRGNTQRTLQIEVANVPTSFKDTLLAEEAAGGDGLKPFWFWDLDASTSRYWMELVRPVQAVLVSDGRWNIKLNLREAN